MMSGIGAKNTTPEITIRKLLHGAGYRFRIHVKNLPGKPDIVLKKYETVVFVHGCFWHGHENCSLFKLPKSRPEFWEPKIEGNRKRDVANQQALINSGWKVLSIWECSMKGKGKLEPGEILAWFNDCFLNENIRFQECRGKALNM
jgi:DNA mismatch endonuclease (patch repair protein)